MSKENKSRFKLITGSIVAVVLVIAVIFGANLGKTKNASPSDSIGGVEAAETSASVDTSTDSGTDAPKDSGESAEKEDTSAKGKELFPIRTPTRKDCTLAPILVADKKGYFAEEGLKLVFTGELNQAQILPSILNGNNDFADTHPNDLALKVFGGAKIKGVARSIIEPGPDKDERLRHMWFYVNDDAVKAGVKTWKDLGNYKPGQKLKFAGWPNTCNDFVPNKALDKVGVPRDKFEWVTFDSDLQAIQALKLGQVDVIGPHPPFYDAAEEAGLTKIGDSSDAGLGEATGVYLFYFPDKFLQEHPEETKAFVRAVNKAQKWANANPEQAAKWTGEFIGVEVKGNHYYSETTKIDEETIKPWIEDLVTSGALKKDDIKISDIITHEFEGDL